MMPYIIYFTAGLFAGSFFYTLALRYSSGMFTESPFRALFGRSACPSCGRPVGIIPLVPLIGYIVAAGRCRECGAKVSPLYPLAEIAYGLLAVAVARFHGQDILSLHIYLICSLCLCIAIIDVKSMVIPSSLVAVFLILSVYPVFMHGDFMDNLYGFLLLTLFFMLMLLIFPGAFGGGDIKLYAAAGFLLGLEMSVVLLEVSLISGALFGVLYGFFKGRNFRQKIPFAPFISAGIVITLLFGNTILLVYYRAAFSF